jgi:hypothetical protein
MWDILVLALGAAFYPTLLAIVLVVLTRPRPARLLGAYLVGGMLIGLGVGFVFVFELKGAGVKSDGSESEAGAILDIVAGALSLLLALVLSRGHDPRPARLKRKKSASEPKKPSWTTRAVGHDSLKMAFGLGVLLDLPSVWYLIALKDIATGNYSSGEQVLLIIGFNLIMFVVIEAPLIAYLLSPERAAATVDRFNAWIRSHVRQLTEAVAGGLGAYLVVKGVAAL